MAKQKISDMRNMVNNGNKLIEDKKKDFEQSTSKFDALKAKRDEMAETKKYVIFSRQ